MLGSEGEYLFDCQIDDQRDFIEFQEVFFFRISEFSGGILPEFEMNFRTRNRTIIRLLHEGTLIKAKIGRTRNTLNDLSLFCTSYSADEDGAAYTRFNIVGFAANIDYMRSPVLKSYSSKSGVEAVLECAALNFKIDSNITKSNDSQVWYQPNVTNKNFIDKTVYRSDLGQNFLAYAITQDGKFILRDIAKDLSDITPKWKFVNSKKNLNDQKEIAYVADATLSSNSGIINAMIGYGFDFSSYVAETEDKITALIQSKSILSNTNKVGGSTTSNRKQIIGIKQNKNVHDNYNKSYHYNLTSLMNLSRVEIPFSIDSIYYAIRPLDKASFFGTGQTRTGAVNDQTAGLYYVTSVSRQIENRHFVTTVKLNRESINEVK